METKKTRIRILSDVFISTVNYNTSILDYFYFRFYKKKKAERQKWAGTGFMYEYQREMNPPSSRDILSDKSKFYQVYAKFIRRKHIDINKKNDLSLLSELLANSTGKLVLKNALGQVGAEVEVINCKDFTTESILSYMRQRRYNLVEEFVVQHPRVMELSPAALNTLRIITQLNKEGNVDLLGARLRISVNSHVDNMAAGNLAAPINIDSGMINGAGVYSDITKADEELHPVTGISITGFKIPFWNEGLQMAMEAALLHPENKSVGWDIAITANGPELIEGNHNWCKLLWQMPVNKGLKHVLESYINQ